MTELFTSHYVQQQQQQRESEREQNRSAVEEREQFDSLARQAMSVPRYVPQ